LKLFGQSIKQARRAYESFVAKGVAQVLMIGAIEPFHDRRKRAS
jgi:hypothetical protein